jgi:hypothetical protein
MATLVPVARTPWSRDALVGGIAFLDGTTSPQWGLDDLRAWFGEHLLRTGCMMTPLLVSEPSAGSVPLYQQPPASPHAVRELLAAARARVLGALRGLSDAQVDDRFLTAAIFTGRVSRQSVRGVPRWLPRPRAATPLSDIVLSLFAADALAHREIYDQLLSVCDTCDRVTFHTGGRRTCPEHMAPPLSGFIRKLPPWATL